MTKKSVVLRSGMWYTISNFISQGIVFLCTSFFTRALTKAEFGEFSHFISVLNIMAILFTLNLESTFISAKRDYSEKNDTYLRTVLQMSTIMVLVGMLICFCLQDVICAWLSIKPVYLWLMMLYILFLPAINLSLAKARFLFHYKWDICLNCGVSILSTLLSILLVCTCKDALLGRILGYVIPTVAIGLVCYVYIFIKGKKTEWDMCRYALKICLPYIPHLFAMTSLCFIDRIMITKMCGEEYTAVYGLGYSCATIVTVLMTSYNSAYAPWLVKKLEAGTQALKKESMQYIILFLLPIGCMLLLVPELVWILGGNDYAEACGIVLFVAMGVVFQFIYTMYVNIEQFYKKTVGMAIASVTAAGLNILLNWLFIPVFGYTIAAVTTLVGYLFLLYAHMFLVKRIGKSGLYNTPAIIGVSILLLLLSVVLLFLYQCSFIRYGIGIVYVLFSVCYLFKKWKRLKA